MRHSASFLFTNAVVDSCSTCISKSMFSVEPVVGAESSSDVDS